MYFHDQKIEKILELLAQRPYWKSVELAKRLGASRSTVQRCLLEIHQSGLAQRIHGGIRRIDGTASAPIPVSDRAGLDKEAKQAICQWALAEVAQSGYVYLDAGTTVGPLAAMLDANRFSQVVFVTNDVSIALVLSGRGLRHVLVSGQIHPVTQTISGAIAQRQICEFHFECCFISADAITPERTAACALADEAMLKQQAMAQSDRKILLAASSKWGRSSGVQVAELGQFDVWITEKGDQAMVKSCEQEKVELVCANED